MTRASIQTLPSGAGQARRLATRLGLAVDVIDVHRFPDGELRVRVGAAAPVTIIYAPLDHPNDKLVSILFAAEALRRAGAGRLVLVAPYLCYMRQDAAFTPGEAIGQKVIGQLLADTVDRVVTVDAHLHRTADIHDVFPGIEAADISAVPAIADAVRADSFDPRTIVVGPDEESRPWLGELAARLGLAHAVAQKTRHGDRSVAIAFEVPHMMAGRPILLIDDIASSGGTLIACARALAGANAGAIDAVVVHALFPTELTGELTAAGLRSIRSTDSVPHPTNAIALDGVLAAALRTEIGNSSPAR